MLAGTNITSVISTAISTALTNFLSASNQFINNNQFVGTQTFAGPNKGQTITMYNGVLTTQLLTTAASAASTGVIQTLGGISANATSWFNGIINAGTTSLQGLTCTTLTATGTTSLQGLTATTITCNGGSGSGPYLTTGLYFPGANTTYTASQLGINQVIRCEDYGNGNYTITLPDPTLCGGQVIYIWNSANLGLTLAQTGSASFSGKQTGTTISFSTNQTMILASCYYYWIVMSN